MNKREMGDLAELVEKIDRLIHEYMQPSTVEHEAALTARIGGSHGQIETNRAQLPKLIFEQIVFQIGEAFAVALVALPRLSAPACGPDSAFCALLNRFR